MNRDNLHSEATEGLKIRGGEGSDKLFGKLNLPTQVEIGLTDLPNAPLPPIPPALHARHI